MTAGVSFAILTSCILTATAIVGILKCLRLRDDAIRALHEEVVELKNRVRLLEAMEEL